MNSTIQLLDRALEARKHSNPRASERDLSKAIGLSPSALANNRLRGNLSPIAAGHIAALLGENIEHWMAIAAIEAEGKSTSAQQLKRILGTVRKS